MTVPSFAFLAFALVGALIFNLARHRWRTAVSLVLNLTFLATFSHQLIAFLPFAGFIVFGYFAVLTLKGGRRILFWPLLITTLIVFFWLKKYTFIPSVVFLRHPYITVGVSYVFFRIVHLVIDANSGDLTKPIGPIAYLAYALDFTCLVAGPIQLYPDYLESTERLTEFSAGRAIERIATGFFKVFIVAAIVNAWHKAAITGLAAGGDPSDRAIRLAGVVGLYPIYLWANFSGYTDAVVGIALLFQRALPENFDHPFSSKNFVDFWSRWHISLSSWLKTYVYNPLILNLMRRLPGRGAEPYLASIAFFATFFLVGAWHGQTSEFLFFGLLQGGGVSVNKLFQTLMIQRFGRAGYRRLADGYFYGALCRGVTFTWFGFTLLWFWSRWGAIERYAGALTPVATTATFVALVLVSAVVLAILEAARNTIRASGGAEAFLQSRYFRTAAVTAMITIVLVSNFLLDAPAPEIVYKAF